MGPGLIRLLWKMMPGPSEFICKCFYEKNIYIQKYRLHITYIDDAQFHRDYRQHLRMQGCATDGQYEAVLEIIKEELVRRQQYHVAALERHKYITSHYEKLHSHLWKFDSAFIDPRLKEIVDKSGSDSFKLVEEVQAKGGSFIPEKRIYQFPVFDEKFCNELVEELSNFDKSSCPKGRPNTMNNHSVSLDELGLSDDLLREVIVRFIQPFSGCLYEDWGGKDIDSFKAFVVRYGTDKDTELSLHYDNAEVTLNVCLTRSFEDGNLEFGSLWNERDKKEESKTVVEHKFGMGVLHRGHQTHRALPTTSGFRCNLIIWMRSSSFRNKCCPMCGEMPSFVKVPYAGDGFLPVDDSPTMSCTAV